MNCGCEIENGALTQICDFHIKRERKLIRYSRRNMAEYLYILIQKEFDNLFVHEIKHNVLKHIEKVLHDIDTCEFQTNK